MHGTTMVFSGRGCPVPLWIRQLHNTYIVAAAELWGARDNGLFLILKCLQLLDDSIRRVS